MSKEAMKLALEAMKMAWDDEECSTSTHIAIKGGIKALEEALKQEQGEPVAWRWGVPKLKNGKFEWRYSINKTREDAIPLYTKEQL